MLLYLTMVSLYIGLCRYIRALFYVFESDTHKINQITRLNIDRKTYSKLRIRLISMITFHLEIFQFMEFVQQIMSGPIFRQFCTYAIFIGHSLNSQVSFSFYCENKQNHLLY